MTRKPSQLRAKQTVEDIIDAGFRAIMSYGVMGTSTRHIADLAGVSVGSVYEYFNDKEAIYEAMSQHFVDELYGMLKALTPGIIQMELAQAVETILYRFRDFLSQRDQRYLIFLRYASDMNYVKHINQVELVLMRLIMQYMEHHPQYLKITDFIPTLYVCINSGIFNVLRYLIIPSPMLTFDDMVRAQTRMVMAFMHAELREAEQHSTQT